VQSPFAIHADTSPHYFCAASHRPLVRRITILNNGWEPVDDIFRISAYVESASGRQMVFPAAIEFPSLGPGDHVEVSTLRLKTDFAGLAALDEAERGYVVIELHDGEQLVGQVRNEVEFLAYDQMMMSLAFDESFAAFVLPRHPVVTETMLKVRQRLETTTGSGSTQGLQAGPVRVLEVLEAIWAELLKLDIKYSNPPASFEGYGQKIRTPDVIIREKAATCLDSAVLVASFLAASGLDPFVVRIHGHAFAACWMREPHQQPRADGHLPHVISNLNEIENLFAQGALLPIETTVLTKRGTLKEALDGGAHHFHRGIETFKALVDVDASFRAGVRSLPLRTNDGRLIVTSATTSSDDPDQEAPTTSQPESAPGEASHLEAIVAPRRIRRWLDALLDISRANSLINLKSIEIGAGNQPRSAKGIRIPVQADLLAAIENAVMASEEIRLTVTTKLTGAVLDDPTPERLANLFASTRMLPVIDAAGLVSTLQRDAQSLHEESDRQTGYLDALHGLFAGADAYFTKETDRLFRSLKKAADDLEQQSASNQLYLCIGTLVWQEPDSGALLRSPLYMVPVRLSGSAKTQFTVKIDEGAEITPNYCLLEKLRTELDLRIPEMEKPVLDDSGIDVDHAISAIRQQLGSGRHADIRVEASATLAVLDFASFRTWKDLRDNWQSFIGNDVVRHLVEAPFKSFENAPQEIEDDLLCPIACDESQLEAVRWAAEGRSFVLEGPPGTGKSQTIANLIAASMALGKRVLFVAEKQVALEVVSRRLAAIGLDPFCIVMHHESATPDGIREQLRKSLAFSGVNRGGEWNTSQATVTSVIQQLTTYRDRLTSHNAVGHNLWKAHQESIRVGEPERLTLPAESINVLGPYQKEIEQSLLALPGVVGSRFVDRDNPWQISDLHELTDIDFELLSSSISSLDTAIAQASHLTELLNDILGASSDADLTQLQDVLRVAGEIDSKDLDSLRKAAEPHWLEQVVGVVDRCHRLSAQHGDVVGYFAPAAYPMDLTPQLTAAMDAVNAGFFGKKKKLATLSALMVPITARTEEDPALVLSLIQRKGQVAAELDAIRAEGSSIDGTPFAAAWNPLDADSLRRVVADAQSMASRASAIFSDAAAPVRRVIENGGKVGTADGDLVGQVTAHWRNLLGQLSSTPVSIERWLNSRTLIAAITESLTEWRRDSPGFLELQRWVALVKLIAPLRRGGLSDLADRILHGEEPLDDLHDEFIRARAAASRGERLTATGFGRFDRKSQNAQVERLMILDSQHKDLMRDVIPHQLVERRPFKPGMRMGQIGKLEAELGRKVRRISLPKLIREHGEVVTHLTPCFLMSPDAVARLLPADKQFFDIVVFDEASQIKVANAIPAMGRAKSVVVVGDSQQMPPSVKIGTKAVSSNEDDDTGDDDDVAYADLESILSECRESNIPYLRLKCHFRSRHEGLISFSNQNFYDRELVTFPAPDTETTTPITWHQIDGHFARSVGPNETRDDLRTNEAEARAIVAEVQRRLHDPLLSEKSMGIVTLNEQQRSKILNKLSELADPAVDAALAHPDPERRLFVNALEQVQGDERDVIMMSVAFSYQDRQTAQGASRRIPLQFGPLINAGGERRLNVAVTRAKEEMVVFCSFNPDDMDLRNSQSTGLEMMKEFLKMARDSSAGNQVALRTRDATERDLHRRALADQLRAAGVHLREDVGLSKFRIDLAVSAGAGEGQFLAILLDGPSWAERTTAYDRDILPEVVLRGSGWRRVGRVWLPGFINEPDHVVTTVLAEIDRETRGQWFRGELESRGYEVREDNQLNGLAVDFALRHRGSTDWALGICLTGPNLFPQSVPYVGQTPPKEMLTKVGVHSAMSINLPDLLASPDTYLARIDEIVAKAEAELEATPRRVLPTVEDVGEIPAPSAKGGVLAHSQHAVPFRSAEQLQVLGSATVLDSIMPADKDLMIRALGEILDIEAPIEDRRLASLLAARFGMTTVRASRFNSLSSRYFGDLTITDHGFGRYVWRDAQDPTTWRGYRTSDEGSGRDATLIAPEEIVNAMVDIVEMNHSVYEEELIRETALLFGRKKITGPLRERLVSVIGWSVEVGRLKPDIDQSGVRLFSTPMESGDSAHGEMP
jgi:hypothetical protein